MEVGGGDAEGVGFSCGVDFCQYHVVCQGQGFGEVLEQGFGTGVGVWLEDTPGFFVRIVFRRGQGCFDLCWVMGIVIDHGDIADFSFELETAVGSGEVDQTLSGSLHRPCPVFRPERLRKVRWTHCEYPVLSGESSYGFSVMQTGKGRMSERIVCNIRRCIICFVFESVSDNFARQIFDDVLIRRGVAVDDESTA